MLDSKCSHLSRKASFLLTTSTAQALVLSWRFIKGQPQFFSYDPSVHFHQICVEETQKIFSLVENLDVANIFNMQNRNPSDRRIPMSTIIYLPTPGVLSNFDLAASNFRQNLERQIAFENYQERLRGATYNIER